LSVAASPTTARAVRSTWRSTLSSIATNRVKMTKWRDHERARGAPTRFAAIETGAETADAA